MPILNLGHAIAEQGFRNSGALISELITENRRLQLGYARVNVLGGPVVYVWSRRQVGVLYVGSSANGGARFLSAHHHALRLEPNDVLDIYPMADAEEARLVERDLIAALKPPFNTIRGRRPVLPVLTPAKRRIPDFRSPYFRRAVVPERARPAR